MLYAGFDCSTQGLTVVVIDCAGGRREVVFRGIPIVAKTRVVSFDTVESAIDLLREGKVQVLLGQKYFGWGSEPVKILHGILNGRPPATAVIDSGVDIVTRQNVDAYVAEFKRLQSGR